MSVAAPAVLKIGPRDHGLELSLDEFMAAHSEDGYQYELIDGRLYVSPTPNLPQDFVVVWIFGKLYLYSLQHATIINYLSPGARVFIPGRRKVTNPQPDVACYRDFPKHLPLEDVRWQDVLPFLVIEVLSDNDPDKDLVRNVKLYRRTPSIQEYWIFDTRRNPAKPTLVVHRRQGKRWKKLQVGYGKTYTTALLPGFTLIVDPLL